MITPHHRSVTLRDIANAAGVSHSTVSRALRDDPCISAGTRDRIKALAQEKNYRPDPVLSALMVYRAGGRPTADHGKIAVLDPAPYEGGLGNTLRRVLPSIKQQAEETGYTTEVYTAGPDLGEQRRLSRILYAQGIRGVLVGPLTPEWSDFTGFEWDLFSVVGIGYSMRNPQPHFVAQDHDERCQMIYRKLRELGYKRIGYCNRYAIEINNRHLMLGAYLKSLFLDGLSSESLPPLLYDRYDDLNPIAWLKKHRFDVVITGLTDEFETCLDKFHFPKSQRPQLASIILRGEEASPEMRWPGGVENLALVGIASVNLLHQLICHGNRGIPEQRQAILIEGKWNPGSVATRA